MEPRAWKCPHCRRGTARHGPRSAATPSCSNDSSSNGMKQRLPEKYRAPLVLCYLEGCTNEEAARRLGRPTGSMSGLLSRGRELLRKRLTRRGVLVSAGLLALLLSPGQASAALPQALVEST